MITPFAGYIFVTQRYRGDIKKPPPYAGYKNVTHNQKWCWGIGKQALTNNL